ncbi:MAG TPA: tRNA (adenosine(37)-N6)-dimethylallyltransferase MiaA [Patescibacteria group bacterium]|nr:tRNA (adenosine(37)-N6)-dimethylallyltransferase MiaA [Patescibacteria group bacterium]
MNKILIICGPTATGKTSLAIVLAKKFNGEIISADSRQVYVGMDIGTGKEWGDATIWGYDLVSPKKEFSVAHFIKFARKKIEDIEIRKKLPIIVGGTGLYIKALVDGIPTIEVPINNSLRKNLSTKGTDELYEKLSQMDSVKAASLNSSDRKNPRRLIRGIEIANYKLHHGDFSEKETTTQSEILFIGLTTDKNVMEKKIETRVDERVKAGIKNEITTLLKNGVDWGDQSMASIGYRQWRDFFEGEVEESVVIEEWKKDERKYVKRQTTWFKKDGRIVWFDVSDNNYTKRVEKLVEKWYSSGNN